MKKLLLITFTMACVMFCACSSKIIAGDCGGASDFVTKTEKVGNFNSVITTGIIDIRLVEDAANAGSVVCVGAADALELVDIYVKNGTLFVGDKCGERKFKDKIKNGRCCYGTFIVYYSGNLQHIGTDGTGDIIADEIRSNSINVISSGTGDIEIGTIKNAVTATITSSGTGDIEVGKCEVNVLNAVTSGTGDIEVKRITATTVNATSSGTGDVTITGSAASANLIATGTGDVNATSFAAASISKHTAGTGSISQ